MSRIILLVTVVLIFAQKIGANFETDYKYIKICNQTSPISLRTMNEVMINKKLSGDASSNFKCFLHCLFMQYRWMDEEGGFELHEMRNVLEESRSIDPPLLEFIMYTCTGMKSVDKCERAYMFIECFWRKTTEEPTDDEKFFYSLDEDVGK